MDTGNVAVDEAAVPQNSHQATSNDMNPSQELPPSKRVKLDPSPEAPMQENNDVDRRKGEAPIKKEFLIPRSTPMNVGAANDDNDEAESAHIQDRERGGDKKEKRREKKRGQNTNRRFKRSQEEKGPCSTIIHRPEFSPDPCSFGESCRYEHDLRKYLKEYKREDLKTFQGMCPVWETYGVCYAGWRCRFVGSHMTERELDDGRKELILVENEERKNASKSAFPDAVECGVMNIVSTKTKQALNRKRFDTPKASAFIEWIGIATKEGDKFIRGRKTSDDEMEDAQDTTQSAAPADEKEDVEANRAQYTEPPFLPSEKRRLYFGPETPVLAPLTTQGNLPFRRLCVELGAQFTYSEMAMSVPLIQGTKGEWALMKAHESEILPPTISPTQPVVQNYDNSRDFKFGAQIAANKPWQALKATEVLTALCPHLRVIDLNCGCPIDLVYREGAGSALLDHPSKLEKILRGMNSVSGEIPITAKIRMGTKDNVPTALKLAERLVLGGKDSQEMGLGPPGIGALTLHGRSRQQRYTRQADWEYISECAALVKRLNEQRDAVTDTVREADERLQPSSGKVYFLGNGDCYSHEDYYRHIKETGVDSVMLARGPLIKPWLFEEIQAGQYLDKSATERLSFVEKFARYGLESWGSDEHGVGTTRRFLLEWLNFTHRYIPIGLLEHLPPRIQDRAPAWQGRNELETLLASPNYKDWLKITEMFLGPTDTDFQFTPKHKSSSYEAEG
ncbi:tRNA-dihydrouridine synthase 3 [Myotisia sp. PD_48]|nr:tRNA-dihydrouridine synthase 3 [Myotisia sp. PD_48]